MMNRINEVFEKLTEAALRLPEAEEGSSCNKLAFKARKKAFLYLGEKEETWNIMLKLSDSIDDVEGVAELAEDLSVSEQGWLSATFAQEQAVPPKVLEWVEESYRALVSKTLVRLLDGEK